MTINTSPRDLTLREIQELQRILPDMSKYFVNAKTSKRCKVRGILVEENVIKKSCNSVIHFDNYIGTIRHILLIGEEFYFVLEISKEILATKSQYRFLGNLPESHFCLKKCDMLFSKAIMAHDESYFTTFPNQIECD